MPSQSLYKTNLYGFLFAIACAGMEEYFVILPFFDLIYNLMFYGNY